MSNGDYIRGAERIAAELNRDESTVRRWFACGVLRGRKDGPFPNSAIEVRTEEIERLKRRFGTKGED